MLWPIGRFGGNSWAKVLTRLVLSAMAWVILSLSPAWAQALVPVPPLTARVIDQTGNLAPGDVAALEQQLKAFEQQRGTQIVVLVLPSTAPEDIADFTQRLGDAWKIGRRDVGGGPERPSLAHRAGQVAGRRCA
jgi:uncharacterized protein